MDAHALLTSQGWRGTGHSLHPTSDKTGLARPLLVSQKQNNLGVGKKQHRTSDMWWMNAFDKSLKGLDTSKEGTVVQTVTNGGLDMVVSGGAKYVGRGGGLFASFVRGECLSGTITPEEVVVDEQDLRKKEKKKRRRQIEMVGGAVGMETKEERRARKAAKRAARLARESTAEQISGDGQEQEEQEEDRSVKKLESKEQRKERKRQKKLLRQAAEERTVEVSSESAKKRRKSKIEDDV